MKGYVFSFIVVEKARRGKKGVLDNFPKYSQKQLNIKSQRDGVVEQDGSSKESWSKTGGFIQ